MIFVLSDTLLQASPGAQLNEVIRCVTHVLIGYCERSLDLRLSKKIYTFLLSHISDSDALLALNKLGSQIAFLSPSLSMHHITIVLENPDASKNELLYTFFMHTESIQPVALLCENLFDCSFYFNIAIEVYSNKNINATFLGGGGSTTAAAVRYNLERNVFFVVILDSDMHYPDAAMGSTYNSCLNVLNQIHPTKSGKITCKLDYVRVLEAENLVPYEFLKDHCVERKKYHGDNFLKLLDEKGCLNYLDYIDIKKGVTIGDIKASINVEKEEMQKRGERGEPPKKYFKYVKKIYDALYNNFDQFYKQYENNKDKIIFPPINTNMLEEYVNYVNKSNSNLPIKRYSTSDIHNAERQRIAQLIYEWCYVSEGIY